MDDAIRHGGTTATTGHDNVTQQLPTPLLVLVDGPRPFDRRTAAPDPPPPVGVWRVMPLDRAPTPLPKLLAWGLAAWTLPVALGRYARPLRRILRRRGIDPRWPTAGFPRSVHEAGRALAFLHREAAVIRASAALYAHDQACGLVALLASFFYGKPYIYDAHEMVPFRARRYGLLRRCLEAQIERMIVRRARACYVVNRPIARFYRRFYGRSDIRVRSNDFFGGEPIATEAAGPPTIVYVGASIPSRQLHFLYEREGPLGCRTVFAVEDPTHIPASASRTVMGLGDYEARLRHLLAGTASYMWCVFDPSVLSYRWALPNKLFQALAFGIPVIAAPDTYVGTLARRYGLGVAAEPMHLTAEALWQPQLYAARRRNVAAFRTAVRAGTIRV